MKTITVSVANAIGSKSEISISIEAAVKINLNDRWSVLPGYTLEIESAIASKLADFDGAEFNSAQEVFPKILSKLKER